ncbi:precorrin-8X methylmutase [Desulfohalovibrio reitneri]|uniref:precorrin-8X methylmutase n=1 Tax=Desulfohalovibrio reitneri TaxID=1307759 RepID=UPI0004A703CD|nr:precorrin-8X methylmutase [Desulfohalovibrio reitneri]
MGKPPFTLISDPQAIERESMARIEAEVPEPRPFQGLEWLVARRMVHTTADFELLDLIRFSPGAAEAGRNALASGATVLTDTRMALCGIPSRRLEPLGCNAVCLMEDPETYRLASVLGVTRAAAAVDVALGRGMLDVVVIGNAPTALIRLMEHMLAGQAEPRLVVGMPVGFVNAAESKAWLESHCPAPYVTISGRKGGSALAACVVNALAQAALESE